MKITQNRLSQMLIEAADAHHIHMQNFEDSLEGTVEDIAEQVNTENNEWAAWYADYMIGDFPEFNGSMDEEYEDEDSRSFEEMDRESKDYHFETK